MSSGATSRVPAGISLDNWLSAPYSQWSFQHVEDFVPTAVISRGTGPVAALPAASAPMAETPVTSTGVPITNQNVTLKATVYDLNLDITSFEVKAPGTEGEMGTAAFPVLGRERSKADTAL